MRSIIGSFVLLSSSVVLAALPPGWERAREIGMVVADTGVYEAMRGRPIEAVEYKGRGRDGEQAFEVYEVRAERCVLEVHLDYQPMPSGMIGPPRFALNVAEASGCDSGRLSAMSHGHVVLESLTTDSAVRLAFEGEGRVRISSGMGIGAIALHGGELGLSLDGDAFVVETLPGAPVYPALQQLRAIIESAGYRVVEEALPTIDTLELRWTITARR
jgi:hypothetical protein